MTIALERRNAGLPSRHEGTPVAMATVASDASGVRLMPASLFMRAVDRTIVALIGAIGIVVGVLLWSDTTARDDVLWSRLWPIAIGLGGVLAVGYAVHQWWRLRLWSGSVLPVALVGRGLALVNGIAKGSVEGTSRAWAVVLVWTGFGMLVAVLWRVYLPLPPDTHGDRY